MAINIICNQLKNLNMENKNITVSVIISAPIDKVWNYWTLPEHITQWYFASDDWHAPRAENDIQVGGKFTTRMEAKDGSFGFDFNGIYDEIKTNELISYAIEGGRKVSITFSENGNETIVTETFEAENENPIDMQRAAGRQF
jgi:uncharacterized protein YndB with AHSA1/START domain